MMATYDGTLTVLCTDSNLVLPRLFESRQPAWRPHHFGGYPGT